MSLTIELTAELEASLRERALEAGVPLEEYARQLLAGGERPAEGPNEPPVIRDNDPEPLNRLLDRIWREMPDEVRDSLPEDGASQHDHYIYGTPKREV